MLLTILVIAYSILTQDSFLNELWKQNALVTETHSFRQISRCVSTQNETEQLFNLI